MGSSTAMGSGQTKVEDSSNGVMCTLARRGLRKYRSIDLAL